MLCVLVVIEIVSGVRNNYLYSYIHMYKELITWIWHNFWSNYTLIQGIFPHAIHPNYLNFHRHTWNPWTTWMWYAPPPSLIYPSHPRRRLGCHTLSCVSVRLWNVMHSVPMPVLRRGLCESSSVTLHDAIVFILWSYYVISLVFFPTPYMIQSVVILSWGLCKHTLYLWHCMMPQLVFVVVLC